MDEGPGVGSGLAGEVTYPYWTGSTLGSLRRSFEALPKRRRLGAPHQAASTMTPTLDERKRMDGWMHWGAKSS